MPHRKHAKYYFDLLAIKFLTFDVRLCVGCVVCVFSFVLVLCWLRKQNFFFTPAKNFKILEFFYIL